MQNRYSMQGVDSPVQGLVLAGRYRLESQLGKGGMSSVWIAEHLALRSSVAVKLLDPALAASDEGVERFQREAQAAASLRSAHVVQVLDYGVDDSRPFLVMELLKGENLGARLERVRCLTPEKTLDVVTQVARAIGRAHEAHIVHRDLKPENIFLVDEGDHELVKVLDFGIAKTSQQGFTGLQTRTGVTMGTPYYMSPEQAEGKRAVDFRSDLWALGVIASECLTGERPFDGETFGELLLNICARPIPLPSSQGIVPAGFDEWFVRATNRNPEQRFSSAQDLATQLRDVIEGKKALPVQRQEAVTGPTGTVLAPDPPPEMLAELAQAAGTTPSVVELEKPVVPVSNRGLLIALLLGGGALIAGAVAWFALSGHDDAPAPAAATSTALEEPGSHTPPATKIAPAVSSPEHVSPALSVEPSRPSAKPGPKAAVAPKRAPSESPAIPTARSKPKPLRPAPTVPAPIALKRCYADAFTGAVRVVGSAGPPGGATTFNCAQNPFTGKYQRK